MSRTDELLKKYPSIPRDVILRHDVIVQGVRDGEDLDKVSYWRTPVQHNYQSYDYDVTLKEIAEKTLSRTRPGSILRPEVMIFKSGLGAQIRLRSTSPYTVREESEGKFALYEEEERVQDIYFPPHIGPRATPGPVTSKGTPISSLLQLNSPTCFGINPLRFCEYFNTGDQCHFCNYNATQDDARSAGLKVPVALNLDETIEAYRIRSSETRLLEGTMVMGALGDTDRETGIYYSFIEKIASAASYKPHLKINGHAMDRKHMERLRDIGLDCLVIHIEVMHPELFPEICPGKNKRMSYEHWIEAFHVAVDVFGVGHVGAKTIPGVTLLSPNGHKTWQEARDHHIETNRWLINNGVVPWFIALWPAPGSVYSQDRSYEAKFPPTEFHLDVALAHHEAMEEAGLYEKMDKFLYCGLNTSFNYAGEIGMLSRAGDMGKWMADVVPQDANFLAKFIQSIQPPAKAQ